MLRSKQTSVLETVITGNTITVTRNIEDVFGFLFSLKFTNAEKNRILHEVNLRLGRLSFSESAQKNDILFALKQCKSTNEFLYSILKNEQAIHCLVNLIFCGKYILDYKGDRREIDYINQFKNNLKELSQILGGDIREYLQRFLLSEENMLFVKIISVAYGEMALRELNLDHFRASELMGHNIAYKVAKYKNKLEHLVVNSSDGKQLETYVIREIEVYLPSLTGQLVRDEVLRGLIILPDYGDNIPDNPTITIAWPGTRDDETRRADLQIAAGEESYRCGEDQVAQQMVDAILKFSALCGKPVKVIFAGHSLGGSLAQLSYHTLQRILALSIYDVEIKQLVIALEAAFNNGLDQKPPPGFIPSMHQRSLQSVRFPIAPTEAQPVIRLVSEFVSAMSLDVWSDADVLPAVEDHSNALSLLLDTKAQIAQAATFGRSGLIQARRQGTILSKAGENGAIVKILQFDNESTIEKILKSPASGALLGSVALPMLGLSLLSAIPGALVGAGLSTAVSVKSTWSAHSKKHFEKNNLLDGYEIYFSHHPDGELNDSPDNGYKKIQQELASKKNIADDVIHYASGLIQHGPRMYSQSRYHQSRFDAAFKFAEKQDAELANTRAENVLAILVNEMKDKSIGFDTRIIATVNKKKIINFLDSNGVSLLQHAIQCGSIELASDLLKIQNIDVNLQDKDGMTALHIAIAKEHYHLAAELLANDEIDINLQNAQGDTPILVLMMNVNMSRSSTSEAYALGVQLLTREIDLELKNKKDETVEKIYKTWNWSGLGSARAFSAALTQVLAEKQRPMKKLSALDLKADDDMPSSVFNPSLR